MAQEKQSDEVVPEKTYSIAQAGKKCGLTAFTLRYYDKEGLLPFVRRDKGGRRVFVESDFRALALVTCLKNTGMTIKDIHKFIVWCGQGDTSLKKRYEIIRRQKELIQRKLDEFNGYMKMIDYKMWYYATAIKAGTEAIHKKEARNKVMPVYFKPRG